MPVPNIENEVIARVDETCTASADEVCDSWNHFGNVILSGFLLFYTPYACSSVDSTCFDKFFMKNLINSLK